MPKGTRAADRVTSPRLQPKSSTSTSALPSRRLTTTRFDGFRSRCTSVFGGYAVSDELDLGIRLLGAPALMSSGGRSSPEARR